MTSCLPESSLPAYSLCHFFHMPGFPQAEHSERPLMCWRNDQERLISTSQATAADTYFISTCHLLKSSYYSSPDTFIPVGFFRDITHIWVTLKRVTICSCKVETTAETHKKTQQYPRSQRSNRLSLNILSAAGRRLESNPFPSTVWAAKLSNLGKSKVTNSHFRKKSEKLESLQNILSYFWAN